MFRSLLGVISVFSQGVTKTLPLSPPYVLCTRTDGERAAGGTRARRRRVGGVNAKKSFSRHTTVAPVVDANYGGPRVNGRRRRGGCGRRPRWGDRKATAAVTPVERGGTGDQRPSTERPAPRAQPLRARRKGRAAVGRALFA